MTTCEVNAGLQNKQKMKITLYYDDSLESVLAVAVYHSLDALIEGGGVSLRACNKKSRAVPYLVVKDNGTVRVFEKEGVIQFLKAYYRELGRPGEESESDADEPVRLPAVKLGEVTAVASSSAVSSGAGGGGAFAQTAQLAEAMAREREKMVL